MIRLLIALTLCGSISNMEGRIGVRIYPSGLISYIHRGSPAENAGLKKDDYVILVEGKTNNLDEIVGEPNTDVKLLIKRGLNKFEVIIKRTEVVNIK